MSELANYIVIRKTYENFKNDISGCTNIKELKYKVQKFLSFISSIVVEDRIKKIIEKQKEVARRILLVINLRYLILFIYKHILQRLVRELVNLINLVVTSLR